jgi:hypothetical protein
LSGGTSFTEEFVPQAGAEPRSFVQTRQRAEPAAGDELAGEESRIDASEEGARFRLKRRGERILGSCPPRRLPATARSA